MEEVKSKDAPQPIGAYSQAVAAGDYVFVSGQLGLDPGTGLLTGDDIRSQTLSSLDNIDSILKTVGLDMCKIVKTEVFLKNMTDFPAFNEIYASKFQTTIKPARYVVQAAALPKGALVEIACTAYRG